MYSSTVWGQTALLKPEMLERLNLIDGNQLLYPLCVHGDLLGIRDLSLKEKPDTVLGII